MKPPEQPRVCCRRRRTASCRHCRRRCFPQHPELMTARGRGLLPEERPSAHGLRKHIYRAMRGWAVPWIRSRVLPGDFHPIIAYLFNEWKCNLDCHYCWAFDNSVRGMTEDTAKRSHRLAARLRRRRAGADGRRAAAASRLRPQDHLLRGEERLLGLSADQRPADVAQGDRQDRRCRGGRGQPCGRCVGRCSRQGSAEGHGAHPRALRLPGQEAVQVRLLACS